MKSFLSKIGKKDDEVSVHPSQSFDKKSLNSDLNEIKINNDPMSEYEFYKGNNDSYFIVNDGWVRYKNDKLQTQ